MKIRHSIIGLVEILKWMEAKGYNRTVLLAGTHINEQRLSNPKETVLPSEELTFYRNLMAVTQNSNIVLEAGFNLKLATYGIWGLALISSPTFEKAIELGIQFIDFTYTYNKITFFVEGEYAGLRINQQAELGDLERPMTERDVSAVFVLFQTLLQKSNPVEEVCFGWTKDDVAAPLTYYETLFHCPVSFGHAVTEVRFPLSYLQYELPQYNDLAMQLCMNQLEEVRPELTVARTATEKVQSYLASMPLYRTNMETCAGHLKMSSRTLRRKLTEEKVSYQAVLDEFRRRLAYKFLENTHMTVEEIAERLGYSNAANFSHAYKKWTGKTPRSI